jgi:hypothetical protein
MHIIKPQTNKITIFNKSQNAILNKLANIHQQQTRLEKSSKNKTGVFLYCQVLL